MAQAAAPPPPRAARTQTRAMGGGPRQQLLAWTGLLGAGLITYIYVKSVNAREKKRVEALAQSSNARASDKERTRDGNGLPTRRRGGVGVSSASSAYGRSATPTPAPASSSSTSTGLSPEALFLDPANYNVSRFDAWSGAIGGSGGRAREGGRPLTLAQYRANQRALMAVEEEASPEGDTDVERDAKRRKGKTDVERDKWEVFRNHL